jgi:hypothetical protein
VLVDRSHAGTKGFNSSSVILMLNRKSVDDGGGEGGLGEPALTHEDTNTLHLLCFNVLQCKKELELMDRK